MKKYCTKCGKQFEATGSEVICPSCKAQAAEEVKRAAVLRAKRASWTGESVPVRISGRASTVIRKYGEAHTMPFAESLDALLRTTDFFLALDKAWVDVEPYRSRRRDKHATQDVSQHTAQDTAQDTASEPQDVQTAQAASKPIKAAKTSASKTSASTASKAKAKASASKASAKKG